jgi:ribose 5-phosphate isomerase B
VKLYVDADHNGFELKQALIADLHKSQIEVIDLGVKTLDPNDDYPNAAARVARAVLGEDDAHGILICGSGQGVCIAANRFKGVRASLCWDNYEARAARNDDDANVLCLPARVIDVKKAIIITHTWLQTPFANAPRFKRRIMQIDEIV